MLTVCHNSNVFQKSFLKTRIWCERSAYLRLSRILKTIWCELSAYFEISSDLVWAVCEKSVFRQCGVDCLSKPYFFLKMLIWCGLSVYSVMCFFWRKKGGLKFVSGLRQIVRNRDSTVGIKCCVFENIDLVWTVCRFCDVFSEKEKKRFGVNCQHKVWFLAIWYELSVETVISRGKKVKTCDLVWTVGIKCDFEGGGKRLLKEENS